MYKFILELLKQPLGLPISPIYEYIILLIVNEIAFQVAWNKSSGGTFGSEIHWLVRIPTFLIIWFITYIVISIVMWVIAHWVLVVSILIAIVTLAVIAVLIIRTKRNRDIKE